MANLFGIDSIDAYDRRAIARRGLNNLLTSYADEADIFTEIIQNAVDSIKYSILTNVYKTGESPKLIIVFGRRESGHHYLYVADNGTGMSPSVASNLTVPGFSYAKKKGKTIGYKGVGASYFFAASMCAAVKTIDASNSVTEYTVRGSYEWIKNDGEPEPIVIDKAEVPPYINKLLPLSRGTGVYFQFHQGVRPANLNLSGLYSPPLAA